VVWQQIGRLVGGGHVVLALGMVILGLVTFIAMVGFVALCDRV
jgi:hypothetical protein